MSSELCWFSAVDLAEAIRAKTVSPVDAVNAVIDQIERIDGDINAFCLVTADAARAAARDAEQAVVRDDELGPLHGVPVSIKDMMLTKGVKTTFGSKLNADFVPDESAPTVERLEEAGAISVGKTNTPEYGWLGVTDNLLHGPTRNPWNLERTPGGSSGGGSAAVVAGMAPLALGTDAGGSVRIPAALSGCFAIKANFGRVPVYPFSPAWSLSHAGPMTRTVADSALMLNVIAGPDDRDAHSLPADGADYLAGLDGDLSGLRVAWSGTFGYSPIEPEVLALCEQAAKRFEDFGCTVEEVDPPWSDPRECWISTFLGGAATRLAPALAEQRDLLHPGLAALLDEVGDWEPTHFIEAWFERLTFVNEALAWFADYDLLLCPTMPVAAIEIGKNEAEVVDGQKMPRYGWDAFVYPFNMTGQPAASIPCGFTKDKLPVGLQIVGRRFDEQTVLRAAARFEEAQPWAHLRPPTS
jgi:aspartyl-tRNA(Asn)/glutamyl-tRNA(Gln) amidotransferase subunit A